MILWHRQRIKQIGRGLSQLAWLLCCALMVMAPAQAAELKAKVTFEGVGKSLSKELRPVSSLVRKPNRYKALAPLRRTAEADVLALTQALQSKGYYAASVDVRVRRDDAQAFVTYTIDRGALFTVTGQSIVYADKIGEERPATFEDLGLAPLRAPTGAAIKDAQSAILTQLWKRGYLGADGLGHRVKADFSKQTAFVEFRIRSGHQGFFSAIEVEGVERTDPDYVRMYRPFREGELANREDLQDYRERLSETGLFTEVDVQPQLPGEDGKTVVVARLTERKHRTLGGGLAFATDLGPTANVFWENRNLFRRGETLRAALSFSAPVQELTASFQKNRPQLPGYYGLNTALRNEDTEAFNAQTVEVGGAIGKRWLRRRLTTEGGIRLQYSSITERQCFVDGRRTPITDIPPCLERGGVLEGDAREFRAVSFPLSAVWNSQIDPLDPQDGFLASFGVTPFVGTTDFTRIETTYTDRVFWGRQDGGTLAGRLRIGAIYGARRGDIPATERYFAGGGGSIRGYAFQEASPIDPNTADILGGASLAEFNIEARQHVTKAIELAVFADVGGAFENNTPDFNRVLVGAGIGVRYHTPIGPIRLDVAVPLDRRQVVARDINADGQPVNRFQDEAFQFYIALGQPF